MRLDELEQSLAVYCHALARGDAVYVDPGDFLDAEADAIADTDEDRTAALEVVRERFPDVAELDALYRSERERFDAACRRVGEEGTREWGIIGEILDKTYNGGTQMKRDTLTDKEAKFVEAYVTGPTRGNAYQSALTAGYTESSARVASRDLLHRPRVLIAIDDLSEELRHGFIRSVLGEAEHLKKILLAIADDPNAPATARVSAVDSLLDRVGLSRMRSEQVEVSKKPEKDWDEMAALLDDELPDRERENAFVSV